MTIAMNKRAKSALAAAILVLAVFAFYAYRRWGAGENSPRDSALAAMPVDANAVLYADVSEIRQSAFAAELYAWAPQPPVDSTTNAI
jgi:hypothetical protein